MILGIETSCDETSVAVVHKGKILSNVVVSQIADHQRYGGVMPELASRLHVEHINLVIKKALEDAGAKFSDLQAVAVTYGPGLMGSLHIGLQAAKALAISLNIPLIGVNHLIGHVYSAILEETVVFPALVLIVSGGHTQLVEMSGTLDFKLLGETLDDAVGEAYDKVARVLGLGYPGGPIIDKIAKTGMPKYELPFPKNDDTLDFSYSGLKTAIINLVRKMSTEEIEKNRVDLATSFQKQAVEILIRKCQKALSRKKYSTLIMAGGVAANSHLRERIEKVATDIKLLIPPLKYCGDNGAMIALVGEKKFMQGQVADLSISIKPNLSVEEL